MFFAVYAVHPLRAGWASAAFLGLRQDVALVMSEFQYSERQACKLMSMDRTTYRYQSRPDHNAELRSKLIALARQKPRYGYRRLCALPAS